MYKCILFTKQDNFTAKLGVYHEKNNNMQWRLLQAVRFNICITLPEDATNAAIHVPVFIDQWVLLVLLTRRQQQYKIHKQKQAFINN